MVTTMVTTAILTLQMLFIILKAVGVLAWSWPVIFTPIISLAVLSALSLLLAALIAKLFGINLTWSGKDKCFYYKDHKEDDE